TDRNFLATAGGEVFLRLLPVDRHDEVLIPLGGVHLQQGIGLFGIVAGEEKPAMRWPLACVAQVKVDPRTLDLEFNIHVAGSGFYGNKTDMALEILLVGIN